LLDKFNIFPKINEASDKDFYVNMPSGNDFIQTCNEFWWVCPYVAKGLWRDEILFALGALENMIRPVLMRMLGWYVGTNHNFSVSVGKFNKYLNRYIENEIWEKLLSTYTTADKESIWNALFNMCELFSTIAKYIGYSLSYDYSYIDENNVISFIKHIKFLAKDATEIY
jgi:aminoglycoside 6-adenylyltransferase